MWVLLLNDMRSANIENILAVAKAETKEALVVYLEREKVDGYRDGQWGKGFKQGGPLEWYNAPWDESESFVFAGTRNDWMERAGLDWDRRVGSLLSV